MGNGSPATADEPFRSAAAATADQPSIASGENSWLKRGGLELKRIDDHGDDGHGDDDDKKRRERRTMVAAKRATNDGGGVFFLKSACRVPGRQQCLR